MANSPHVMILASAGSGKTYALTNRFVALLALGAAPEKMVALTFTRKAAGELFDEILGKLATAAGDEGSARRLGQELEAESLAGPNSGFGTLGRRDFLRLLRVTVDSMHRLRLGTLDSFFARIVRAFPLELGLDGDFEILLDHAAQVERRRVLRTLYVGSRGVGDKARHEFMEAFKRATFGAEEKRLAARLDAFLDDHQESFLAAPESGLWGDSARIWPDGSPWLATGMDVKSAIGELRMAIAGVNEGQAARIESFMAALEKWAPGAPLPDAVEYLLSNVLDRWKDVCAGRAEIVVDRRRLALGAGGCRALEILIREIVGGEFRRRIETTRGIFLVLQAYEHRYHDAVRRAGRLTFSDVERLLTPAGLRSALGRGGDPSSEIADRRLVLDYRLDGDFDHWLFDEFQDTSFGQWSILRNLIDEVVQDSGGRRSFFCVGDVKQAIYGWREGDPRLFREIYLHYNAAAPGAITERHLVESWRSGPPVIEMVNSVFGNRAALAGLFPGEASETWNREWRPHRSAVPDRGGQAALLHAQTEVDRWDVARRVIEEIRPSDRHLTCAVLVRTNKVAAAIADHLRRAGIAAIADTDMRVATDNPVGAALLALAKAAAHPGDTFAWEHVRMTPLAGILAAERLDTPEALTRTVLGQVQTGGFGHFVEAWTSSLERRASVADDFSRDRVRSLVAGAGLFDQTGSRDCDEFIAFMEQYALRPPDSPAVVRVMTIHKSKGLGFDVVLLPDLEGSRIDQRRAGLAVHKAGDRSVQWILDLPPKVFCASDPVLSSHVRVSEAEACYESLCLLYVALTRAKRATYIVTGPVGVSKSRNYRLLLGDTLGAETREIPVGGLTLAGAWMSGDPSWHLREGRRDPGQSSPPAAVLERSPVAISMRKRRRAVLRPSAERDGGKPAGAMFAIESSSSAEFGTALHAVLARVEWLAGPAAGRQAVAGATAMRHGTADAVVAAARACLEAPALRQVWHRPEGPGSAEVWRERAFEIVLDGAWVSGVFDRVVVRRDPTGCAVAATVFDFKTDRVSTDREIEAAVARHSGQLNLYRRVAGVLACLPPDNVRCELVFTYSCRAVAVRRIPGEE